MMAKTSLPPGFRFHPTDVELVWYYLKRKIMGKPFRFEAISVVELYKFAPWDLPGKSCLRSRDLEWYFFCPRDKKYSQGSRTNRATDIGYWKTTGKDRSIFHNSQTVGMKKTLIFHLGKAPHGSRTDWVMYEFRLESNELVTAGYTQDAYVLCKIFQKSGPGPRNGEQYGAPFNEEDWEDVTDTEDVGSFPSIFPSENAHLFCSVPQQSASSEVVWPSSIISTFEVGELSHVPEPSGVGESSYMQYNSEVGESSYVPNPSCDDGILLEQVEAYLNSSPTHSEIAKGEHVLDSGFLLEEFISEPDTAFQNVYDDLADPPVQSFSETTDGILHSDATGCEYTLHNALAEFVDWQYMEITDLNFTGEGNPAEFVHPGNHRSLLADYASSYFPGNTCVESVTDTYVESVTGTHMDHDLHEGENGEGKSLHGSTLGS
ncbi:NAC domain-containing protein 53-like isoform X2 [Asparagus officinalis]|uniref:NAC domain-containing protein 53-like isoform X2 n=1 Tax=Asparagus officinalis TaxID=4686 RepID=UPI00098E136F|nr:NAC domain-containing protein 53-like isoform X2 [Asparagus officinalis]